MGRVYALFANGIAGPSLVDRLDGEDAVLLGGRVLGVDVEDAAAPKVAAGEELSPAFQSGTAVLKTPGSAGSPAGWMTRYRTPNAKAAALQANVALGAQGRKARIRCREGTNPPGARSIRPRAQIVDVPSTRRV